MRLFTTSILLLFTYCSIAQQPSNFVGSSTTQKSSSVATQVNQFTGKLGLSVPLYSYESSKSSLKFSVSVDYSSGGANLNQDASCVGTGWNLNAGGMIHREINGKPDDIIKTNIIGNVFYDASGYIYSTPISNTPCGFQYRSVGYYPNPDDKVNQDSEPDEFHFNFLGKSGSFNIPKGGIDANGPKVVTIPQSNFTFSFILGVKPWSIVTNITEIIITDDNGTEYTFSSLQSTGKMKARAVQESIQSIKFYHNEYDITGDNYVTDWLLTKIKDKNSGGHIDLAYEAYTNYSRVPTSIVSYYSPLNPLYSFKEFKDDRNYQYGTSQRLKNVICDNGDNIIFEYDENDRCDLQGAKALLNLKVKNNANEINYGFDYVYNKANTEISYLNCSSSTEADRVTKWLFLKAVKKRISTGSATVASFDYIKNSNKISAPDNILPSRKSIWAGNRYGYGNQWYGGHYSIQDGFGFYSGGETPSGPTGSCNMVDGYYRLISFCDDPKIGYPEIGSLEKVTYPTGSSLRIEYEGNNVLKNGVDQLSYGIRVKKIKQSDGINTANDIVKEYKYIRTDGKSSGFTMNLPPHTYNIEEKNLNWNIFYPTEVKSTSLVVAPHTIAGSPVGYERVEEITSLGKSVSDFTGFSEYPPIANTYTFPFANKPRTADWAYGLLKKQTILDLSGNIVKTTENNFNVVISSLNVPEYKSMKTAFQVESNAINYHNTLDPTQCAIQDVYWKFIYDIYYPLTGRVELLSTTEKDYLKDGSIMSNKVDYEYDPNTYYVKKISSTNSLNEKFDKILFYPTDYSVGSDKNLLVLKGIKSMPVSSISLLTKPNGDKFIAGFERTDFKYAPDISVRPDKMVTMKSKNLVQIPSSKTIFTAEEHYGEASIKSTIDIEYNKYDATGNALETTSKGVLQTAIWDNDQKIIVAKSNASFIDIAYTSFETSEKGNWDYLSLSFKKLDPPPTGKKVFDLTSQTISKSNLSISKTYLISYWSDSGPYSINGNSAPIVIGATANGWTYYKHKILGMSAVYITGSGLIDELRLHPDNARMTSVTYEPLIGLTSESGIDGQIKKYSYDSYGRLLSIKDEFGNISKVYCYNSQGTPSPCGDIPIFKNWSIPPYTSYTLYNQNCPPGSVSSSMQYDVADGKYTSFISQADADYQAAQEAATFGQAIANQNSALCVQIPIYARLTYENVYTLGSETYGDVVVSFYSDIAGTIPANLSSIPVDITEQWVDEYGAGQNSFTVNCSGTSTNILPGIRLSYQVTYCDYGYWPCYSITCTNNYNLNPNSFFQIIY